MARGVLQKRKLSADVPAPAEGGPINAARQRVTSNRTPVGRAAGKPGTAGVQTAADNTSAAVMRPLMVPSKVAMLPSLAPTSSDMSKDSVWDIEIDLDMVMKPPEAGKDGASSPDERHRVRRVLHHPAQSCTSHCCAIIRKLQLKKEAPLSAQELAPGGPCMSAQPSGVVDSPPPGGAAAVSRQEDGSAADAVPWGHADGDPFDDACELIALRLLNPASAAAATMALRPHLQVRLGSVKSHTAQHAPPVLQRLLATHERLNAVLLCTATF